MTEGTKTVPLGILDRKRQGRQQKPLANNGDGGMASAPINQNQQVTGGQQVLQSLASRGSVVSRMNASDAPERQTAPAIGQVRDGRTLGAQGPVDQVDMGSVMSQVLHSRVLICVVIAGLVPCAVTICVVIVGLVPCAAQEIERFSEDTRNKVCMPKIGAQSSDLGRVSARFLVAISPI